MTCISTFESPFGPCFVIPFGSHAVEVWQVGDELRWRSGKSATSCGGRGFGYRNLSTSCSCRAGCSCKSATGCGSCACNHRNSATSCGTTLGRVPLRSAGSYRCALAGAACVAQVAEIRQTREDLIRREPEVDEAGDLVHAELRETRDDLFGLVDRAEKPDVVEIVLERPLDQEIDL